MSIAAAASHLTEAFDVLDDGSLLLQRQDS